MIHLEFPPENVHVAFTQGEEPGPNHMFAVMGEHGNCAKLFDCDTFAIKHLINVKKHVLTGFSFANHNRELVISTSDCSVRFYSLAKYEGLFLR